MDSFVNVDSALVSIKLEVWRPSFAHSRNMDGLTGTDILYLHVDNSRTQKRLYCQGKHQVTKYPK